MSRPFLICFRELDFVDSFVRRARSTPEISLGLGLDNCGPFRHKIMDVEVLHQSLKRDSRPSRLRRSLVAGQFLPSCPSFVFWSVDWYHL